MYLILAWRSHADLESGREPDVRTVRVERAAAMALRDDLPYPIVDVLDVGKAGYCPARTVPGETIVGHAFDVQSSPYNPACTGCRVRMDDLYRPGTYLAWEPGEGPVM